MDAEALKQMKILIVDDQEPNLILLERLLTAAGYTELVLTARGDQVAETCVAARPDLLLLDLHMPHVDGFEVLRRLDPLEQALWRPPVIVLSADATPDAKRLALEAGANDFVTKPFDREEVLLRVRNLLHTRHLQLQLARRRDELEDMVRERTEDLEAARREVLDRLARAAEYRDDDTHEHAMRIGWISEVLARELRLDRTTIDDIRRAAPLHDIGKIGVPDRILSKPGKLDADEACEMRRHPEIGALILSGGRASVLRMAEEIARTHHERWDGGGYPFGLIGDQIPLVGRIVAVADVFDALTHRRPYKEAWTVGRSVEEIRAQRGRHFDPAVVDAFERIDPESLGEQKLNGGAGDLGGQLGDLRGRPADSDALRLEGVGLGLGGPLRT